MGFFKRFGRKSTENENMEKTGLEETAKSTTIEETAASVKPEEAWEAGMMSWGQEEKQYEFSSVRKAPATYKALTEKYEALCVQAGQSDGGDETELRYFRYALDLVNPEKRGAFLDPKEHTVSWLEKEADDIHQACQSGSLEDRELEKHINEFSGYLGLLVLLHKGGRWVDQVEEALAAGPAIEVDGVYYFVPARVKSRLTKGKEYDLQPFYQMIPYTIPVDKTRPFYIAYHDGEKECTKTYAGPDDLQIIKDLRVEISGLPNCNYFYIDDGEESYPELWIEANGNYAYLYFIESEAQMCQSLNDGNDLDPDGETHIPIYDGPWTNYYFVTAETAYNAALEFCQTKERPKCVRWEEL